MKRIRTLILILSLCASFTGKAQQLLWDLDFFGFFDNREFTKPCQIPQTFFGTRLSPEVGVGFRENHQLMAGLSWISEFGSEKDSKIDWTVYYRYKSKKMNATFGSFPRRQLAEEYPMAMQYDSILYFNPNINGVLLQFYAEAGYAEMYVDWRSKQTESHREIFTIASDGKFNYRRTFAGWFFSMNHFAKAKYADNTHVIDNLMFNPYLGTNLSGLTFLDSLQVKGGLLLSANRNRGVGTWHVPTGFLGEIGAEWRILGVKNLLYAGKDQFTFYNEFGSYLYRGDPFYRLSFYDRLDVYVYLLKKRFVECKFSANFHFADGRVQRQQQLFVRFHIDQSYGGKKKQKRVIVF
ncbi:MAG: hypothetical protein RR202_11515 [Bacteroidales bacterium]